MDMMENQDQSLSTPLPGGEALQSLCASVRYTRNAQQTNEECRRVMREYGSVVFEGIDATSATATLVGIFAAYLQKKWHSQSYEMLVEWLTKAPGEVMAHLDYIAHDAWADGPEQDVVAAAGYAARSLTADIHNLSLKERRAIVKAASNAALAYHQQAAEAGI